VTPAKVIAARDMCMNLTFLSKLKLIETKQNTTQMRKLVDRCVRFDAWERLGSETDYSSSAVDIFSSEL
jgi:hypothetical protein